MNSPDTTSSSTASRFRIEQVRTTATSGQCRDHGPGSSAVNCWIVGDNRDVIVVDAAGEPETIDAVIGHRRVTAVVCTQGNRTHTSAGVEVA